MKNCEVALCGAEVRFLTGTDEHGQKIEKAARDQGIEPIQLADRVVARYHGLWKTMAISNDDFIRTTEARHQRAVAETVKRFGSLQLAHLNAGIAATSSVLDTTLEEWNRTIAINLSGVFYGLQACGRAIRDAGGVAGVCRSVEDAQKLLGDA